MRLPIVELDADHPGFNDLQYRERRNLIAQIADTGGDEPQVIDYTPAETATWRSVYERLVGLYPTHACREYNAVIGDLGYRGDAIPQLHDVSRFLAARTGFRMRPVAGLVSPRDFLGALAERVFCSTQYVRHHSQPDYTPEPDVVHELMGHAPMLAVPEFADLSQKIGAASIGAGDQDVDELATLYWYTAEYGVVEEDGGLRAYGAGLLSSYGELRHALNGGTEVRPFDPELARRMPYPITRFQPLLWSVRSIGDALAAIAAMVGERRRSAGAAPDGASGAEPGAAPGA